MNMVAVAARNPKSPMICKEYQQLLIQESQRYGEGAFGPQPPDHLSCQVVPSGGQVVGHHPHLNKLLVPFRGI